MRIAPTTWQQNASRGFALSATAPPESIPPGGLDWDERHPHPPTVAGCLAFASDVAGIEAAEALAREVVARLRVWRAAQPSRVVWRVIGGPPRVAWSRGWLEWPTVFEVDDFDAGIDPVAERVLGERFGDRTHATTSAVLSDLSHRRLWDWRARRGDRLRTPALERLEAMLLKSMLPAAVDGRTFAEVPNPFGPLVGIWRLGYALDEITADAIEMLALTTEPRQGAA